MSGRDLEALAQRLADGEAIGWRAGLLLLKALDGQEGDLAAACRVALAYDDRSGLEGLGYKIQG